LAGSDKEDDDEEEEKVKKLDTEQNKPEDDEEKIPIDKQALTANEQIRKDSAVDSPLITEGLVLVKADSSKKDDPNQAQD